MIINTERYLPYLPELPQQSNKNKTEHSNENFQRASRYLDQTSNKKSIYVYIYIYIYIYIQYALNQLVKIL